MAVAFTGYAFEGNTKNGGHGLKLGFYCCNAAKIAKKTVRESRRDDDGNLKYDGPVKRNKGDCYIADCVVTGSDQGTSDNPKFSLKTLFEDEIFPKIHDLLKGEYEDYIPVIQGDNAGPHIDAEYINYVKSYCEDNGWLWAPQAPQMPHANNLDLAIFPSMSRKHTELLLEYSNTQAPPEEIWRVAKNVWDNMPNSTIARGFVLAKRIMQQVIRFHGDNTFLLGKEFHCGVRNDFESVVKGIVKRAN